jgi:hypothetical protein
MQSPAQPDSSPPSSFAGFLAALARPDRAASDGVSAQRATWSDELLAEDVATLSYEQALRAHARYHADDMAADSVEAVPAHSADVPPLEAGPSVQAAPERVLKEASITIRLSREENAQLRSRAAEAGLTVSAYIRSCTFEAEALRALVKNTLTHFRTGSPPPQAKSPNPRRRWAALFWPGRRAHSSGPNQA